MQMKTQLLSLLLLFSFTSCVDFTSLSDAEVPDYEAEFAIPLINSRVTIQEIIDAGESLEALHIDADGSLRFEYQGSEVEGTGEQAFQLLTADFPPFFPVGQPETRFPLSIINGINLDRLDFKAGTFVYSFQNPNSEKVVVNFEFSSLQKNGTPLRFKAEVPAFSGSGNLPIGTNLSNPILLNGYQLLPENNEVTLRYSAKGESGQDVSISNFTVQLKDAQFSYAEGYLGKILIDGISDSIAIDLLKNNEGESISFADPKGILEIENSFGVPARAEVTDFKVITSDGQEKDVSGTIVEEGANLPYPDINAVGSVEIGSIIIDKSNSNIVELFAEGPQSLRYKVDVSVNPDEDPNLKGFITDSSYYHLKLKVELPLYGTASNYVTRDTSDFNLEEIKNIQSATFKIVTENELGVDAAVQVYFLDDQNNVLETLFPDQTLIAKGAPVDDNGLTNSMATLSTFVEADAARTERLLQASQIVIEVGFSTETNDPKAVKILSTQGIRVKIGAVVTVVSE